MKCEDAVLKIGDYIKGDMSCGEMEEFIAHVKTCPECYDELETYYTISVGMKFLDDIRQEPYNIPEMLKQDLRKQEKIPAQRRQLGRLLIAAAVLILAAERGILPGGGAGWISPRCLEGEQRGHESAIGTIYVMKGTI